MVKNVVNRQYLLFPKQGGIQSWQDVPTKSIEKNTIWLL
jgi:hypothetical protein